MARVKGVMPAEGVNPIDPPDLLQYVWDWFLDLNRQRRCSDMGTPQPLNPTDIRSYFALRREQPARWEVDLIMQLDAVAMAGEEAANDS